MLHPYRQTVFIALKSVMWDIEYVDFEFFLIRILCNHEIILVIIFDIIYGASIILDHIALKILTKILIHWTLFFSIYLYSIRFFNDMA